MTEISGLLQIGLAQPGEPPLALDRLGVTEKLLEPIRHSPRFTMSDCAAQWLIVGSEDDLVSLLGQVTAAWVNSGTSLSWRQLGASTPTDQVHAAAHAASPPDDGLRIGPQRNGIATS